MLVVMPASAALRQLCDRVVVVVVDLWEARWLIFDNDRCLYTKDT